MISFLVHLPDGAKRGSADGLDRAVLVKDGFHWTALVLPLLWLLFNRLWLPLVAFLAIGVTLAVAANLLGVPDPIVVGIELLLALAIGFTAADLKSRGLTRRGLPLAGVVVARNEDEGLQRFADRWIAAPEDDRPASPPVPRQRSAIGDGQPVLGLFPEAGRS